MVDVGAQGPVRAVQRRDSDDRASGDAGTPHMIIIHTCEGGYSGCVGWLRNSAAGASASSSGADGPAIRAARSST